MALQLSHKIDKHCDCEGFLFQELTGLYSSSNTGGWNDASTENLSDIDTAELVISHTFDGTTTTYDALDITSLIKNGSGTAQKTYDITDLQVNGTQSFSSGDSFPDGTWKFDYQVEMNSGDNYNNCVKEFWVCKVACRVSKLAAEVAMAGCDCSADLKKQFNEASAILEAAKWAAVWESDFTSLIKDLNNYLDSVNCHRC